MFQNFARKNHGIQDPEIPIFSEYGSGSWLQKHQFICGCQLFLIHIFLSDNVDSVGSEGIDVTYGVTETCTIF